MLRWQIIQAIGIRLPINIFLLKKGEKMRNEMDMQVNLKDPVNFKDPLENDYEDFFSRYYITDTMNEFCEK